MSLPGLMRSHNCGELRESDIGKSVELCGWVNKYRDLGGLHFIDLRDKHGLTQLGFEELFQGNIELLKQFSLESVIWVKGKVCARPIEAQNNKMATGMIEIQVEEARLLSKAETVPFLPHGKVDATEDLRLKYRYLDLRSTRLQKMISTRSEVTKNARKALYDLDFVEVETPILYKTTPEGARDYIVPSRVHPGKVYALPQSPQTLKQLLMIGNTDRYFQICRCFRDEDLRADRQPEFTQIDIEVSFATQDYMYQLATHMMKNLFKDVTSNIELKKMSYDEALRDYGSDKPDVRFGLKHLLVNDVFQESGFKVFSDVIKDNGLIKAIHLPSEQGNLARKDIDALVEVVKPFGGKGVAWFKLEGENLSGGISKFITPQNLKSLTTVSPGDGLWLFFADKNEQVAHDCADAVRRHLGKKLELYSADDYAFLWVYDFPLFEVDYETGDVAARHHPFTMPKEDQLKDYFSSDKTKLKELKANAYDIVCNGYELGGGSLRIFDAKVQDRMFELLGMTREEAQRQFGFFIEALKYGTPPHGGMAFGLDRIVMLVAKTDSIRDVMAFPKTAKATDLMAQSPSEANPAQLSELKMKWDL